MARCVAWVGAVAVAAGGFLAKIGEEGSEGWYACKEYLFFVSFGLSFI